MGDDFLEAEEFASSFTPTTSREQALVERLNSILQVAREATYGEHDNLALARELSEQLNCAEHDRDRHASEMVVLSRKVRSLEGEAGVLKRRVKSLEDDLLERAREEDSI